MSDDDFEGRLKALLNEHVDAQVGARRPAPPFVDASRGTARRRAPWLTPLIAAACVAAVVGGGLGLSRLVADNGNHSADQPTVSSPPKPSHTPSPSPTMRTTPTTTISGTHKGNLPGAAQTTSRAALPARHVVDLDGAQISLPAGVGMHRVTASNNEDVECIDYPNRANSPCAVILETNPVDIGYPIDPNSVGGGFGNAGELSCDGHSGKPTSPKLNLQDADLTFGGRPADWRKWVYTCAGVAIEHFEQYAVDSAPGWVLYSDSSNPNTSAFLAGIVKYSVLPVQSRPLRLTDFGVLRSAIRHGSTVTVAIDRVIQSGVAIINNNPEVYTYLVPTTLYDRAEVKIGSYVRVETDGYKVVQFG